MYEYKSKKEIWFFIILFNILTILDIFIIIGKGSIYDFIMEDSTNIPIMLLTVVLDLSIISVKLFKMYKKKKIIVQIADQLQPFKDELDRGIISKKEYKVEEEKLVKKYETAESQERYL